MGGNRTSLEHLQKVQREYEEEVKILSTSTKPIPEEDINSKSIAELICQLFELPHNGRSIREAYEAQKLSQSQWDADSEVVAPCQLRRLNSNSVRLTTYVRSNWIAKVHDGKQNSKQFF